MSSLVSSPYIPIGLSILSGKVIRRSLYQMVRDPRAWIRTFPGKQCDITAAWWSGSGQRGEGEKTGKGSSRTEELNKKCKDSR